MFLISVVEKYKCLWPAAQRSSFSSAPLTSPSSTVHVKGRSFNLAHIQCDKEVLLLALPASVLPRDLVLATAERMERVLQLLFGSPQRWVCPIPMADDDILECGHC